MTVRLRPHHLLCILTYVGKGYSPAFVANYDAVAVRLAEGEPVLIVDGPDDICRALLGDPDPHCHRASVLARDGQAAGDVETLLGRFLAPGADLVLDAATLATLRASFSSHAIRKACEGCEWSDLCSTVASSGFEAAKVSAGR